MPQTAVSVGLWDDAKRDIGSGWGVHLIHGERQPFHRPPSWWGLVVGIYETPPWLDRTPPCAVESFTRKNSCQQNHCGRVVPTLIRHPDRKWPAGQARSHLECWREWISPWSQTTEGDNTEGDSTSLPCYREGVAETPLLSKDVAVQMVSWCPCMFYTVPKTCGSAGLKVALMDHATT